MDSGQREAVLIRGCGLFIVKQALLLDGHYLSHRPPRGKHIVAASPCRHRRALCKPRQGSEIPSATLDLRGQGQGQCKCDNPRRSRLGKARMPAQGAAPAEDPGRGSIQLGEQTLKASSIRDVAPRISLSQAKLEPNLTVEL
jgi:hypothetical protein